MAKAKQKAIITNIEALIKVDFKEVKVSNKIQFFLGDVNLPSRLPDILFELSLSRFCAIVALFRFKNRLIFATSPLYIIQTLRIFEPV